MRVLLAGISGSSGIDTYTRIVAEGLAAAGHDVAVTVRQGARDVPAGASIVPLRPVRERVRRRVGPLEQVLLRPGVRSAARAFGADVVHATTSGLAVGGAPLVVSAWDPVRGSLARVRLARARGQKPRDEALYALVDAAAARRAAAVAAVTHDVARTHERACRRVEWMPPFVPDDTVQDAARPASRDVVLVANFVDHPRKGLPLALAAMGHVQAREPGARLILVGGWLGGARALPPWCEPLGRLPHRAVQDVVRRAGCLLVASRWEEFGYAGLEALAAGAPVACTPLPGLAEIGDGVFAAPSAEPAALGEAIARALACAGFEFPAAHRASVALPRLVALYEDVAGAA